MNYNALASADTITKTADALAANGFKPVHVHTKEEALAKVQELIPEGISIINGASETLREIGFVDLLKSGKHPWKNLHDAILAETDQAKQGQLRREATLSEFYVGSVSALTETGELLIASNSGSQMPSLSFSSPNIALVVGANKIVPTLNEGFTRLEKHVVPLEDERLKKAYGIPTTWAKTLVLHKENPMAGRSVYVIIVDEILGF